MDLVFVGVLQAGSVDPLSKCTAIHFSSTGLTRGRRKACEAQSGAKLLGSNELLERSGSNVP